MEVSPPKPRIRRVGTRALYLTNLVLTGFTLGVYALGLVGISPAQWWVLGLLSLTLPVLLVAHLVFLTGWLVRGRWRYAALSALALLLFPWQRTLALPLWQPSAAPQSAPARQVRVLSYNVRMFNVYARRLGVSPGSSGQMIDWLLSFDADIKCVQELYNRPDSPVFNAMERFYRTRRYQATTPPALYETERGYVGVVIFSRFPIVKQGQVALDASGINKCIWADIATGGDTLRVFNVHLQSMGIRVGKVLAGEQPRKDLLDILRRLRLGIRSRATQTAVLEAALARSPHPVLVCGDFNDLPYGYPYSRLRQRLHNAFEQRGSGFGFTYNGPLFFLRIDNQFCDPRLRVRQFTTHREATYSDHFPLSATYAW